MGFSLTAGVQVDFSSLIRRRQRVLELVDPSGTTTPDPLTEEEGNQVAQPSYPGMGTRDGAVIRERRDRKLAGSLGMRRH
jgi:hypothetical protein